MSDSPKKKPSAHCSVCERRHYVRTNGTIGYHAHADRSNPGYRTVCRGVGQPPASSSGQDGGAS